MQAFRAARSNYSILGEIVSYLMVTAVIARGLVAYPEVALQIAVLVAFYIFLILAEPILRRQSGWGQPLFILAQIGVMIGLFILTPLGDFWAVMLLPACIYVMRHYRHTIGWTWIGVFIVAMSIMLIRGQGFIGALEFIIIYIAAYLLVGSYALMLKETVAAREESEYLLKQLQHSNAQLQVYVAQVEELAAIKERNRLARELHDAVTQSIFSMTLITRSALILQERDPKQVNEKLQQLQELAQGALQEMRGLIYQLRTLSVEEDGLIPVLQKFVAGVNGREKLQISIDSEVGELPLSPIQQQELYRIIQEAINNILKHARAERAVIGVALINSSVTISITDNGIGFDPGQQYDGDTHIGLDSMRERVNELGGSLTVKSERGGGTEITVTVPVADEGTVNG